jgi:WD40 repeat protein/predicted Ser/Thr protein kinase
MSESHAPTGETSPVSKGRLIDRICDRFETAWRSGRRPRLERYLRLVPKPLQAELFPELLLLEVAYRARSGDTPVPGDYALRFPDHSRVIDSIFVEANREPDPQSIGPLVAEWAVGGLVRHTAAGTERDDSFLPFLNIWSQLIGPSTGDAEPGGNAEPRAELAGNQQEPSVGGKSTATEESSKTESTPEKPPTLGDYELLEKLGRGGMGIVYRARQIRADRTVALKVIRPDRLEDLGPAKRHEWLERFRREGRIGARIEHDSVVTVYDVGETDGQYFYSMRYVEGRSLAETIREGLIPGRRAASYMEAVARAVHAIHAQGVVHRDLKPRNILLDRQDRPYVTDFGLSRWTGDSDEMTQQGACLGTPSYISPEQAQDPARASPVSDVYSLGATLYEMLVGRPPFQAAEPVETLRQVLDDDPVPPRRLNPAIERDVELICLKCLQKEPHRRYTSAEQMADELQHYLRNEPLSFTRPVSSAARLLRWCRRNPSLAIASGMAGLFFVAVATLSVVFGIYRSHAASVTERLSAARTKAAQERVAAARETQRLSAGWALDWGIGLCERGDAGRGMLWFARALEVAPDDDRDLERTIRTNLAGWRRRVNSLRTVFTHSQAVAMVALSPDGRTALTGSQLWDTATGKPLGPELQHDGAVSAVAFSPDGTIALTGSVDGTAKLWDARTGNALGLPLQHRGDVTGAIFSPDGKSVLTRSTDNVARLWETATGRLSSISLQHQGQVTAAIFSPDGRLVLTGSHDSAQIWEAATGKPVGLSLHHDGEVRTVAFSPDGRTALTGSKDKTARLWDVATGKQRTPLLHHQGSVTSAAFSPDGELVLTGSSDGTARLWRTTTGEALGTTARHGSVTAVAWQAGVGRPRWPGDPGIFLTANGDGTAELWRTDSLEPIGSSLNHQKAINTIALSTDGRSVLTGSADGTARLWDLIGGAQGSTTHGQGSQTSSVLRPLDPWFLAPDPLFVLRHQDSVYSVAFSPDGNTLLTGSFDQTAQLWDRTSGKRLGPEMRHHHRVRAAAFSPDGKTLVTGTLDGTAQRWQAATGKKLGPALQHKGSITVVTFSPDGSKILTGSIDFTAQLWDAVTGMPLGRPLKHRAAVSAATFSPDGSIILTGSMDFTAQTWEVVTGKQLGSPLRHKDWVKAVAFSPDGKTILTGSADHFGRLWEADTGRLLASLEHRGEVLAVAFSPDGKMVLTASADGTAQLWQTPTGEPAETPPLQHHDQIHAIAFSPDGKTILTASADGTARLWDAATGKPLGHPFNHSERVHRAVLSPDGHMVLTGSTDHTARLWNVPGPVKGSVERIILWAEVISGMELQPSGACHSLDTERWRERLARLEEQGGPPIP